MEMPEIPLCLREFLQEEEDFEDGVQTRYFDIVSSKSQESSIRFYGEPILPPLLTEDEKSEMRQYRRAAVKQEQKLFDARRERYSSLLLQVMTIMDKLKEREEKEEYTAETGCCKRGRVSDSCQSAKIAIENDYSQKHVPLSQSLQTGDIGKGMGKDRGQSENGNGSMINGSCDMKSSEHSEIPPYYQWKGTSSVPEEQVSARGCHTDDLPGYGHADTKSHPGSGNSDQNLLSSLHQTQQSVSETSANNTRKQYSINTRDFHSMSSYSDGNIQELFGPQNMISIDHSSTSTPATSTMVGGNQSVMSQICLSSTDHGRVVAESDSLASTSLSVAFTDSSITSLQSTVGLNQQPSKSAQRQLNMDGINNNFHQSHQSCEVMPYLTSTPTAKPPRLKIKAKCKAQVSSTKTSKISSNKSNQTTSDQEKALEKLEMMRKKLLEEKEKQIMLLRQQELTRLRKQKEKQSSRACEVEDSLNEAELRLQRNSSQQFSGMTIYSIAERSFEGSDIYGEIQADAESQSDKENKYYMSLKSWNKSGEALNGHGQHGNDILSADDHENERHDKVWESYSHALGSRPFSLQTRIAADTNELRYSSSPYIRQEFRKQLEVLSSQGGDGQDKFAVLSAHAKGFLTRRLLQADKIQAVVKTIKDTRDFLADISKEGARSYQDKSLQDRVQAQLAAAKSKLYDIFFKMPVKERMGYLAHSRSLARERENRKHETIHGTTEKSRRLSSATMKAMQRRQEGQQGSIETNRTTTSSPLGKRKNWDIRVLKPVQSHKSPPLPEKKARSNGRKQGSHPTTAATARQSVSGKSKGKRPATACAPRSNGAPSNQIHRNLPTGGEGKVEPRRPVRTSREEKVFSQKPARRGLEEKPRPLRPNKASLEEKDPPHSRSERENSEERGGHPKRRTSSGEKGQPRRPTRMSLGETRQPSMPQSSGNGGMVSYDVNENKPKAVSTTRKISRSMAPKFTK